MLASGYHLTNPSHLLTKQLLNSPTLYPQDGCRFNFLECSFALFLAFAINVSVIAVSGAVCSRPTLSPSDLENCQNIDLDRTPFLLQVRQLMFSVTRTGTSRFSGSDVSIIEVRGSAAGRHCLLATWRTARPSTSTGRFLLQVLKHKNTYVSVFWD
jgi:hypothetical protein